LKIPPEQTSSLQNDIIVQSAAALLCSAVCSDDIDPTFQQLLDKLEALRFIMGPDTPIATPGLGSLGANLFTSTLGNLRAAMRRMNYRTKTS